MENLDLKQTKLELKRNLTTLPNKSQMINLCRLWSQVQLLDILSWLRCLNNHLNLSYFTLLSDSSFMSFRNHGSKTIINWRGSNNLPSRKSIQWKLNLNRRCIVCGRNLGSRDYGIKTLSYKLRLITILFLVSLIIVL